MGRKRTSGRPAIRDRAVTVPAILGAAETEFAAHGFAGARTEAIADRAKVVKGLIFHYFKSKEGLYEAVLTRALERMKTATEPARDPALTAAEALLLFVSRVLAVMKEHPLDPTLFMLESIQGQGAQFRKLGMASLYERAEELLERGTKTGEFRSMNVRHAAIQVVGLCGFYFCAANNLAAAGRKARHPLSAEALDAHTAEVLAFVKRSVIAAD